MDRNLTLMILHSNNGQSFPDWSSHLDSIAGYVEGLEVIFVGWGRQDFDCHGAADFKFAEDLAKAFSLAVAPWVVFWDGVDPFPVQDLGILAEFLAVEEFGSSGAILGAPSSRTGLHSGPTAPASVKKVSLKQLESLNYRLGEIIFCTGNLRASVLSWPMSVRAGFETQALATSALLACQGQSVYIRCADPVETFRAVEPDLAVWRNKETYGAALVEACLKPLEVAERRYGCVPPWLQKSILMELQWYFALDRRERAPTVVVSEVMAVEFHEIVSQILRFIPIASISRLVNQGVHSEIVNALLSYKQPVVYTTPELDFFDKVQGLLRLTYFIHGRKPHERFEIDGQVVEPQFAKYRACNFFRRMLYRQRIVWLPLRRGRLFKLFLDDIQISPRLDVMGHMRPVAIDTQDHLDLMEACRLLPQGKGGLVPVPLDWQGIKARLLLTLAKLPVFRHRFAHAWVFMDRDIDADDNAEHFYRWVRQHHPEINAWFLLSKSAPDWGRLQSEGFRLVEPNIVRKLLLLISDCVLSSHPDYVYGGFDRSLYGCAMNWRFVFLQHGVIKDDMSHWLSGKPFDLFVTTSPQEHASIEDDDTPYSYTRREMCRSGLPRHDSLLKVAEAVPAEDVNILLVMPTWRGALSAEGGGRDAMTNFAASEYALRWGELLHSERLRDLLDLHGMKLVFMPHPNAVPFLAGLKLPSNVEVLTKADVGIQQLFARTALMITDFSSVAFEMAYLRRPVIYYHYDFEQFYGGDHNWRQGYYDYARDGFGPIAFDLEEIIEQVSSYMLDRERFMESYLPRMERALPERDGKASERLFNRIIETIT